MATLPRTPLLGAELADPPFSARGLHVRAVREGSTAAEAGVVGGDVIVGVGGLPVRSAAELRRALAAIDEDTVAIETERGIAEGRVRRRPPEVVPGADVVLGHLDRDGVRLRTILTRPHGVDSAPAVLFLQGIGPSSLDFAAAAASPVAQLLHALAADLVTLRLERRGVGDSEGELPDFVTEVADAAAALAWLAEQPFVRGVVLLGHSVGGMVAPLLVHPAVVGRVVTGTSARPWTETLAEGTRRQLALRGSSDQAEAAVAEEARALREDAVIHGRSRAFHEQLAATDLRAAWRAVAATSAPTLVLAGGLDWVVADDEQHEVAALANGELRTIAGLDHAFTVHAGLAESLRDYARGAPCPELAAATLAFVRGATAGGPLP